jgi:DNA replication protein DnaC
MPYNMVFALQVVERIAKGIDENFAFTIEAEKLYRNMILFFHGDSQFPGDLNKGILLQGPTGTGKTLAMQVMSIYQKIDNVKYIMNGKIYRMNYDVVSVNDMVNGFMNNAFDGIHIYCTRYVTCLDDIGTEIEEVKYYGNNLDVISHVLSERYAKRLLTFGTTNFPIEKLEDKYGDRIISRMYALFNFIVVKDRDFRRPIKKNQN